LATQPQSANTDYELFDIVLSDVIENKDFELATGGLGVEKPQIVFCNTTRPGRGHLNWELDTWIRAETVPSEIRDDLWKRNPPDKRFLLARYHPTNPDILVRNRSRIDRDLGFYSQFPKACGYVEANLPAYSRDGRTAVVRFTSGPSAHADVGYADRGRYLLRKRNGRWEIIERSIWRLE
jgi:hypothetical protein